MMRNVYLVAYDIADDKRLRKVYRKMRAFGDSMQYSVFCCELSPSERQLMKEQLWELLNLAEDRVMIVDLGPAGARGYECIEFWGQPRELPSRGPVIV